MTDLVERYRDRWLLVVDKPAGLPSQPARGGSDAVVTRYPGATLPHRLDAAASGLLMLVLDPSANQGIAESFREHLARRTYLAVADGRVDDGAWSWPVEGRPARSDARAMGHGEGLSALELTLHTGRKHQLRVHAAMAGHPLAGDRVYGGSAARRWPRLALHAARLSFRHPITAAPIDVSAPLPDDLRPLWTAAGGPIEGR
jgi:23S rRNA-/tRNA-specific pseudouridylate synthase